MTDVDERRRRNYETVRTMLACFSAGDKEGQLAHVTDDVVYAAPYYPQMADRHGRDEMRTMLEHVEERFEQVSYVVTDWFPTVDPDLVIVEVEGDNVVRGGDRHYRNHYVMFLRFRDGLVHEWTEFSNPNVYAAAVDEERAPG
jgi:ketosteroid isomerase-like protein